MNRKLTDKELVIKLIQEIEHMAYNLRPTEDEYKTSFDCHKELLDERKKIASQLNQTAIKYLKLTQEDIKG